jgi:hypothetical protein
MEATPELSAEGLVVVRVLADVLDRLVAANVSAALADPGQVTKFHAMKAPGIGIQHYLERVQKYASCSNECFILALIYIDRLIQRNNFLLTELNVHRVIITAVLLAAKFFDDAYYNNAYYAKVGGVLVAEMNGLEVDFLFRINFTLHVAPDVFQKYRVQLLSQAMLSETRVNSPYHQPAPAPPHRQPPATQHVEHNMVMKVTHDMRDTSQITPSPPPTDAGRLVEDLVYNHGDALAMVLNTSPDIFFPVHRAHSEPVDRYYSTGLPRCSQQSFSAPPINTVGALRYPGGDMPYVLVDHHHQIYPIQSTLVHHQHGDFSSHGAANATNLASSRMLAGMSRAGF